MNRRLVRNWRKRQLAAFLLLFPLVSACAAQTKDNGKTAAVDPPPEQVEQTMLQQTAAESNAKSALGTGVPDNSVTVYLEDPKGYLAPMTLRTGPAGDSAAGSIQKAAETAMTWLTRDASRADQLPGGFTAVLPAGTKVASLTLDTDSGTAAIDFADPLPPVPASGERKMLESIVWSITELPGIDKVKLTLAGKPIRSLPSSGLPVDEVLTRGIGINIEQANGVKIARSMPVTLYFSARSANGDGYFVPVTRLIDRTPDRLHAALQELIKGPIGSPSLHAVVTTGVTIEKLARKADRVDLSLQEEGWTPDRGVPAEMMEALILTATEAAGAPQVKAAMNGDDTFLDTQRRTYDHPVTRPVAVNMLER